MYCFNDKPINWKKSHSHLLVSKKGHLPAKMHLELFTILHELIDGYENVVVLGDGEFDNHTVITHCRKWNWHFVFRTAKNTKIYDGQEEFSIQNLEPFSNERFTTLHDVAYTKDRHRPVNATV